MAESMRLQKFLALSGVASRRASEELIVSGKVTVNGELINTLGSKVDPDFDRVCVNGKEVLVASKKVYVMLHKPKNVVTTKKDNFSRQTVIDLLPDALSHLYPVGRLDYDSEGLLLLTNDGDVTFALTHPSRKVQKTYRVKVDGLLTDEAIRRLQTGVFIEGRKTMPAKVLVKEATQNGSTFYIAITEGRNRQVRKMCTLVGYSVLSLCRVAEGPIKLGNLPKGKWRYLTDDEIKSLKEHAHGNN